MSNPLLISLNELRALLRKFFESVFNHQMDWDALSDQVIWLECRGQNGIKTALSLLPKLNSCESPDFVALGPHHYAVEACGRSMFELNEALCDLALATARLHGSVQIDVRHSDVDALCLYAVGRLTKNGLFAAACWRGGSTLHWAAQGGAAQTLVIGSIETAMPQEQTAPVTLFAAQTMDDLHDMFKLITGLGIAALNAKNIIKNETNARIDSGFPVEITDYEALCAQAARVLVETSEYSRRGAGD